MHKSDTLRQSYQMCFTMMSALRVLGCFSHLGLTQYVVWLKTLKLQRPLRACDDSGFGFYVAVCRRSSRPSSVGFEVEVKVPLLKAQS
jgi:hypothetical protein